MTKALQAVGLLLILPLFTWALTTGPLLEEADAQEYKSTRKADADVQCRAGQVLVYHFNMRSYKCTSESGAAQWAQHGIAEIISYDSIEAGDEIDKEGMGDEVDKSEFAKSSDEAQRQKELDAIMQKIENGERLSKGEQRQAGRAMEFAQAQETAQEYYKPSPDTPVEEGTGPKNAYGRTGSGTITSTQDPGVGHEGHQLAVLLPPSDNMYVGRLSFSASEPVQYVSLIGPIAKEDVGGQPTWSPDGGETNYALVFVDNGLKSGGWAFSGNALALHTMTETPFTATYSIVYSEVAPGVYPKGTVATETLKSSQDPGVGHEGHQLAIILPPRDIPYQGGVLAYSASDTVQLVALHGPLGPGEDRGQPTWSPDGETVYALTLEMDDDNMGVWNTFSGNALALHTMTTEEFTVTYSIAGLH